MKKCIGVFFAVLMVVSYSYCQNNSNAMLWRISSKQGGKPSYLFGTMHLAQEKYMHFTDSAYKAIAETDIFFGELDYARSSAEFTGSTAEAYFAKKMTFLDSASQTPAWKAMVERINRKYGVNINPDSLEQFAGFGSKITADMYEPEPGVQLMDVMLSDYAQSLGKKTGGLETYVLQIDMLYSIITARLQDSTLDFDDEKMLMANFKRYYQNQRLDSIDRYLQAINPNYRDIIFTQRNKTMADSIEMHTNAGPAFFAIGCGHLPGNDGVIALLRKKGFAVSPVYSDNKISLLLLNELKDKWKTQWIEAPKTPEEESFKEAIERIKAAAKTMIAEPGQKKKKRGASKNVKRK
jgi:uncharacterized protein YbaP (TraB family)